MRPPFSLTEGPIPRALLGFALVHPLLASLRTPPDALPSALAYMRIISVSLALGYYRFGGWRKARMGVSGARAAPVPSV